MHQNLIYEGLRSRSFWPELELVKGWGLSPIKKFKLELENQYQKPTGKDQVLSQQDVACEEKNKCMEFMK